MNATKIEELERLIKASNLVEACQAKNLITPEERKQYFIQLNTETHAVIEDLLKEPV